MANYFDFMQNIKNPFTGAIDAITDPVDEGGINIFGAGVNKEFEAMKTAGLLTDQQYNDAIKKADIRSKRSGIIQGLLGFGLQNFDKGYGSAFDPRYLKAGLASAIPAAQKPFDKLSSNVMNIETLKTFKAAKDKEVSRLAMIKAFQSGKYGTVEDGTFTKKEMALFPQLDIAQMYDMIKPKTPTSLAFQNVVKDGKTQKYQVPKGPFGDDKDKDGVPDNWKPVGESYISEEQRDIPTAPKSLFNSTIFKIKNGAIGFEPSVKTIYSSSVDVSAVAEQLGEIARKSGNPINDAEKVNKAIEYLKESEALVEGSFIGANESYDSKKFLDYVDEQIDKSKTTSSETKNSFKEEIFEIKGKKYKTLPNSDKLIEVI